MPRVTLEQVSIGEEKLSKSGKPFRTAGIKVNGKWYNGFASPDIMQWKAGDTVTVELFQQEYQGKTYDKFKLPSKLDELESRVAKLESILNDLKIPITHVNKKEVEDTGFNPDLPFN